MDKTWKVFFDGNFWGHHEKTHAGTELRIDGQFDWAGHHWVIPAAYSCSKGLVVDCCMRIEPEDIRSFMKKWNLTPENDSCENFTREQQMQMELENPLCLNFTPKLELNGYSLRTSHGCAVTFNPCLQDGIVNELEAQWAVEHYGLDGAYGWGICRSAFPWAGKRRPEIKSLSLTMDQQPIWVPGPHFRVHAPGDTFAFTHLVSGKEYVLTVQELEQQTLPKNSFASDRFCYPTHYTAMTYSLSLEPDEHIMINDCNKSDRPLEIGQKEDQFTPSSVSSVSVIGGGSFIMAEHDKLHTAYSALHFKQLQEDVEWCVTFSSKQYEEMSICLIK